MNMTRAEFLSEKRKLLGYWGLEKEYGCPYLFLRKWTLYEVGWTLSKIITLGKSEVESS